MMSTYFRWLRLIPQMGFWGIFVLCLCVAHDGYAADQAGGAQALTKTINKTTYSALRFSELFFQYHPPMDIENPDGTVTKKSDKPMLIPEAIKAFNGKKVIIKGFVMPLESDGDVVKSFLLVDQIVNCLFCQGLGMDQWLMTTVNNPKGVIIKDEDYEKPIAVYGTIEIGENVEDGVVTSIYRLKADGIETAHKKFLNLFN